MRRVALGLGLLVIVLAVVGALVGCASAPCDIALPSARPAYNARVITRAELAQWSGRSLAIVIASTHGNWLARRDALHPVTVWESGGMFDVDHLETSADAFDRVEFFDITDRPLWIGNRAPGPVIVLTQRRP